MDPVMMAAINNSTAMIKVNRIPRGGLMRAIIQIIGFILGTVQGAGVPSQPARRAINAQKACPFKVQNRLCVWAHEPSEGKF